MTIDGNLTSTTDAAANVASMFLNRVQVSADKEAFRYLVAGEWVSMTWRQTADRVEALAAGLLALGIETEQRIGLLSSTRYEWVVADLAIMCAGAATTTVYPNTNAGDTAYILADSQCRIVFAEDTTQLAKLTERRAELPDLTKVVLFDGTGDGTGDTDWVITLADLAESGKKYLLENPSAVRRRIDAITPKQLATLIYTSGTTGRPKGVRLPHSAWAYEANAVAELHILSEDDLQLLWLPMAHAFGKVLTTTQLACGYVTAIDGRVDKIVDNLAVVKPTFMGAAPRVFEKAHARIVTTQQAKGGLQARLFAAAFSAGLRVDRRRRAGRAAGLPMSLLCKVFDRLVFSKVRAAFGGRIRFFVSGAAPLNRDIGEWFHAAGLLILEGYGLTETTAGTCINRPDHYKLGTVGLPFDGMSVRISDDQGEIQIHGPAVMDGYHNLPDKTADAFTDDGWLRTGDVGTIDADGFLTVTGRIKEMFKTSGGKYVAPPAIEAKFIAMCPYASQFMVFGEGHNYCVALIALDADMMSGWAAENGLEGATYQELVGTPAVRDMIAGYVDTLNADLNRWETVKKWALLNHDLSVDRGELTPSLKVKRAVVAEQNKHLLDSLYT
ncbi:AMP-dependent synthetase/ligase [Mycolicibacterium aubagnense]|uniref:Acyl-CoA synthetase n=1 Tax=Mycolicibacterium aubagnense TaxID=319707 RepID=A0ABM7I7X5_9MYCO|nr:AMP-dependent synthetase/ligase [Mycolicibacterium aubagnense]TLH66823.1 long-chain fatty acid--CoA ligase [Mycolicibacterium aubagnense]WGI30412.1 AMP-dependent synthetase/ligase [Mycolicibacterium aubagnense]BBX82693.1 AMP-dependent synthetase [Mycolicibacterium aubagnense]